MVAPADVVSTPAPTAITIPKIGVSSTLVPLGLTPEGALQVPDVRTPLQAGWFAKGVAPGAVGPAVVVGHVDGEINGQKGQPGVFYRLHELAPGDQILIDRADGSSLRFMVAAVESYDKSGFPTGKVYGDTERPELRLITCHGTFDHAAHSYEQNLVVFAMLTP
jgi:hypothetical protein